MQEKHSAPVVAVTFTVAFIFMAAVVLAAPSLAATGGTVNVSIGVGGFSPNPITIVIGTNNTVTWTNTLSSTQNVVPDLSDPDQNWGSAPLGQGQSYSFTFTIPGTYGYNDGYTTSFIGTVHVLPNPHATSTTSTIPTTSVPATTTTPALTSTSSPASSSGGGIPEFPFAGAAVGALTLLVVVSYLLTRQAVRGAGSREP